MKLLLVLLFTGLTAAMSAQGVCRIDASNANQDFCTACSNTITDGVFTGTLEIYATYTINADCLSGLTFANTFDIWVDRYVNLTFAQDPQLADGTTSQVTAGHHVHSGYIQVFGTQYTPRGNGGTNYSDLAALMTSPENNRTTIPGPAPAPGGEAMLPISLRDWEVALQRDAMVLSWITDREVNNDYFTVEHSTDGVLFAPLTEVSGAGNSKDRRSYTFRHTTPAAGTNFYRLLQTDTDGTTTVYPVITAEYSTISARTALYPNPAFAGQTVNFSAPGVPTTARLYHLDGRLVASTPITPDLSASQLSLPANLEPGVYVLRFGNQSERLLVH